MPTYVVLANYTEGGFESLSQLESDEFLEQTKETIRAHDGELHDYYLTMGQYDVVAVVEFPDDHTCAEAMLAVLETGIADTETLRAFPEAEARELVGGIGA